MGLSDIYKTAVGAAGSVVPMGPPGFAPLGVAAQLFNKFQDKPQGPSTSGGEGGGGRRRQQPGGWDPATHPVHAAIDFIRDQSPGMGRKQARKLLGQYQIQQAQPGLSEFVQSKVNTPNPNVMQMFYANTVAPYLKETGAQFQQGAAAGTEAMKNILAGSAPSPAIDVLKSFLPLQAAGDQKMGAALEAATVTAPYYDQLLTQLQENIAQQQRTQFYNQQLAAGGAAGGAAAPSFGQQVAAGTAGKV